MVAWYWLIVAFSVGGSLGYLGGAAVVAAKRD